MFIRVVAAMLLVFTVLLPPPALAQSTDGGVCGRTPQVRDALLARVQADNPSVTDCSQVTTTHLEALTGTVDLSSVGITGLNSGDFAGLTNLVTLSLNGNALSELPAGIFEGLAGLNTLDLHGNPGIASFLTTADAGADQRGELSATVSLDGSASSGGPWGTNISYNWAVADGQGNPVTGLTLTGGDTATPSFVMPATEPDGGLVFTLTVQGRGHGGRNLYKSTDSVSVAVGTPPGVTSVALVSAPTNGTAYGNGESIEVVVTFDEPATVDTLGGTPGIGLMVGTAAKTAGYLRGSGGRRLVFAYEVQATDTDTDGVSVPANGIIRNGGQIANADGAVFGLAHDALADDAGHKVNGAGTPLTGRGVRPHPAGARCAAGAGPGDAAVADCSQVTPDHLRVLIGTLDLTARSIIGLKSGDFANLPSVTGLYLSYNDLQTLPVAVFHGLANMRDLYLSYNDLRMLPDGTFNGLPNLRILYLDNNDLQTLPDGVFEGLANLRTLGLYNNGLQTLSDGVFEGLAKLNTLDLYANPGAASFLVTADAGTDQEVEPSATVRLDGSVSRGGPWGTNISYDWAVANGQGNPVTGLTLTGGNTATPSFVMPATEPDGGLVFTLTVQGRGHGGRNLYKSTDSVSVAVLAAPGVTSVALASAPTIGTTYVNGESIEVVVTFDEPATVNTSGGTPGIGLMVGTAAKTAGYIRGSGSRRLVFAYEVQATDTDTDGVSVPAGGSRTPAAPRSGSRTTRSRTMPVTR